MNFLATFRRLAAYGCAAVLTGYLSAPAHASLMATGVSCSGQGTTMTSDTGYVACSGAWSGNNVGNATTLAAVASQIHKDFGLTVSGPVDITGSNTNGTSGTLTLPGLEKGFFVIALKAGDAFSLYEFNGGTAGISSINFDTLGVGFYSDHGTKVHYGQGLSHADFYASTSVPEPATLALFAAGLAGLGFALSRRRSKI
jgi:hypothetical protein